MAQATRAYPEVLAVCRDLRQAGRTAEALAVLDAALTAPDQDDVDPTRRLSRGWLELEHADFSRDIPEFAEATAWARRAASSFGGCDERAGQAAAYLLLGDVAWATGQTAEAASQWANARSHADAAGAGVLAARALVALALREVDAEVGEALLQAAEVRVAVVPPGLDDSESWRQSADAVRASLAIVRARLAMAAQRWAEARLLLGAAAQAAGDLRDGGLYAQCLRLDAQLARKAGDPQAAVASLVLAARAAEQVGNVVQLWLCRAELVLALIDNEAPHQAAQLIPQTVPAELSQVPAAGAAVLEAYAVLALYNGQPAAAEPALYSALDLRRSMGDVPGEVRALACLADSLRLQGSRPDALRVADQMTAIAEKSGRDDLRLSAALVAARVQGLSLPTADADALATLAGRAGGTGEQLAALDFAAAAALYHGQPARGLAIARQAVAAAETQPLARLRARAQARLAEALHRSGQPAQALAMAQQASEQADAAGDWQARAKALLVAGAILAGLGRADEANLAFSHAQQAATAAHRADLLAEAWLGFGQLQATYGRFADAATAFGNAATAASQSADADAHVRALRGQAWCAREQGQLEAASSLLIHGRELAAAAGAHWSALACRVDQAQLLVQHGEPERALAILTDLDLAACPPSSRGEAYTLIAQIHARKGDLDRSQTAIARAMAVLREVGDARPLGAALYLAGQIAALRGDGSGAGELLGEALVVTARAGLPEQHLVRQTIERMRSQATGAAGST